MSDSHDVVTYVDGVVEAVDKKGEEANDDRNDDESVRWSSNGNRDAGTFDIKSMFGLCRNNAVAEYDCA